MFLSDNNKNEANLFYSTKFFSKLAYFVNIFEKLGTLNIGLATVSIITGVSVHITYLYVLPRQQHEIKFFFHINS